MKSKTKFVTKNLNFCKQQINLKKNQFQVKTKFKINY